MEKKRLDCLIFERGFAESREKAKLAVAEGLAYVNGQKKGKPGALVPSDAEIEVRGEALPYVSRGGLKLEKALSEFSISLSGKTALDIGASTGGFTDCMLQNGARRVYAVDVGSGQLAEKLRADPRIVSMEHVNIRFFQPEQLPEPVDFFSADVSFISLKLVLPAARRFLRETGSAVCLVKPQFEAGYGRVGKKGVVRDKGVHLEVLRSLASFSLENGFSLLGLTYSPVRGQEGNIEYLMNLQKSNHPVCSVMDIEKVVAQAHQNLKGGERT